MGGWLHREKKAAQEIQTRQEKKEVLQDSRSKAMEPGQEQAQYKVYASAGPGPALPMAEAPSHKGIQKLGHLEKREKTRTYSDVQRLGFKQNLLDNVAMDQRKNYGPDFQNILQAIKSYADINVAGDAAKYTQNQEKHQKLQREREFLMQAMGLIEQRVHALEALEAGGNLSVMQKDELKILKIYQQYFAMDTSGYLTVPAGEEVEDLRHVEPDKHTINVPRPGEPGKWDEKKVPIKMDEVPRNQPLFSHEPSINDIAQGGLGDCYLLAALSAVVNKNPQWIKDCMKDNGDGSVTVRLFQWEKHGRNGGYKPKYFRLKKTVPKGEPFASGSLWVQLLEKAYLVSKLKNSASPNTGTDYKEIEGGDETTFVSVLTGKVMEKNETPRQINNISDVTGLIFRTTKTYNYTHQDYAERVLGLPKIDKSDPGYKEENRKRSDIIGVYFRYFMTNYGKRHLENIDDVREIYKKEKGNLPDIKGMTKEENDHVKKVFLREYERLFLDPKTAPFAHEAFSGRYSWEALDIYHKIEEGEAQGKVMTASTHKSFGTAGQGEGLNGEDMDVGLATGHAYTLLGVKTLGKNRYVKLRNPWARGTRGYSKNIYTGKITKSREDEGTHGIFLLELNEFLRYYENYAIA